MRTTCRYLCFLLLTPCLLRAESAALNEPLVSDRPDFTESTLTIAATHLQLETGYTFTQESNAGGTDKSHTLPEALLRIGLSDYLEARLGWEGTLIEDPAAGNNSHGNSDTSIGAKVGLGGLGGIALATIVDMELPTGSENRTADHVQPGLKLLWSADLTDTVAVAGNINYASRVSEGDRFNEWSPSISFGTALTDQLGLYCEYFGIYPVSTPVENAESYLNGGITYLISKDLQLDARVGGGLNENASDLFTGFGVVYRH